MQQITEINIDKIYPNRYQPREEFIDDSIIELAKSIKENGLIQPIVVRQDGDSYEIIAGERRFRACRHLGLTKVPCLLASVNDQEMATLALIENIQREDLSSIDEANAYKRLIVLNGYTQEQLATKVGKKQSTVANKLRLLNLSESIKEKVRSKAITERHARALLSIEESKREEVLEKIIKDNLNVKQTEQVIEKLSERKAILNKKRNTTKGFTQNEKIAINTINRAVDMVRQVGFDVYSHEEVSEDEIKIIITINK